MTAAAFTASYSDWKLIRSRKVVQIVFEVPVEKADEAYQVVGGMPNAGEEAWFAIARLQTGSAENTQPKAEQSGEKDAVASPPSPRRFTSLPLPSQAALLCQDPAFRAWMIEEWKLDECRNEEEAQAAFYQHYRITSRREIQDNTNAGQRFLRDRDRYLAWKQVA